MSEQHLQLALYIVVAVALLVSFVTDLHARVIKNFVTFPAIAVCLGLRGIFGGFGALANGTGLICGLIGMLAGGGIFYFIAKKYNAMGYGDVKLMAVVGAGVGIPAVFFCMVGIAFFGGVHAIVSLIWQGELIYTLKKMGRRFSRSKNFEDSRPGQTIPYAMAIAVGSIWGVMWQLHLRSVELATGAF